MVTCKNVVVVVVIA